MRVKDNLTSNFNNQIYIGLPEYTTEMDSTPEYVFIAPDDIKTEPMSPCPPVRGRKRNASQISLDSVGSTSSTTEKRKKPKKYQLDPSSDPSVKNAVAAKLNRDRKKQEEAKMKTDNDNLRARNLDLQMRLQEAKNTEIQLRQELEAERAKWQENRCPRAEVFFKDIQDDLNAKYATDGNDDFDNIHVDPSLSSDFDLKEYMDTDLRLFSSPGSPEKILGMEESPSPPDGYCLFEGTNNLSEMSSCLDPVLTPSLRVDGSNNTSQSSRNLMGEFNNIMKCAPNLGKQIESMPMALTPMSGFIRVNEITADVEVHPSPSM